MFGSNVFLVRKTPCTLGASARPILLVTKYDRWLKIRGGVAGNEEAVISMMTMDGWSLSLKATFDVLQPKYASVGLKEYEAKRASVRAAPSPASMVNSFAGRFPKSR